MQCRALPGRTLIQVEVNECFALQITRPAKSGKLKERLMQLW